MMGLRRAPALGVALLSLACGSAPGRDGAEPSAPTAQTLLCPELGGNADPLEATFTDAPGANARIRTFVASARGLNDVTLEIDRRAVDTCRAIAHDIGAPELPRTDALDAQCAPMRAAIAQVAKEGIELRIAISPPKCQPDESRKAQCAKVAGPAGAPESADLCNAQAAVYARCSLPSVAFNLSKRTEAALKLGRSLEANLPGLLYADLALGRRLIDHVSKIVTVSPKLAADLKDVGPHGIACVGLSTKVVARSSTRLKGFLDMSSDIVLGLDPEMRAP